MPPNESLHGLFTAYLEKEDGTGVTKDRFERAKTSFCKYYGVPHTNIQLMVVGEEPILPQNKRQEQQQQQQQRQAAANNSIVPFGALQNPSNAALLQQQGLAAHRPGHGNVAFGLGGFDVNDLMFRLGQGIASGGGGAAAAHIPQNNFNFNASGATVNTGTVNYHQHSSDDETVKQAVEEAFKKQEDERRKQEAERRKEQEEQRRKEEAERKKRDNENHTELMRTLAESQRSNAQGFKETQSIVRASASKPRQSEAQFRYHTADTTDHFAETVRGSPLAGNHTTTGADATVSDTESVPSPDSPPPTTGSPNASATQSPSATLPSRHSSSGDAKMPPKTAPPKQPPAASNVKAGATLDSQHSDDDSGVQETAAVETALAPTHSDFYFLDYYDDFTRFEQLYPCLKNNFTIPEEKEFPLHQALKGCADAHEIWKKVGLNAIVARTTPNCCLQVLSRRTNFEDPHHIFMNEANFTNDFLVAAQFGTTPDAQYNFLVSATQPWLASSTLGIVLQIVARTEDVHSYCLDGPVYADGNEVDLPLEDDQITRFLDASLHSKPKYLCVRGYKLTESQKRVFEVWSATNDREVSDLEETEAEDSKPAAVHHSQKDDNDSQLSARAGNRTILGTTAAGGSGSAVSLGVDEDEDTIFEPRQPNFARGSGSSNIQPSGAAASLGAAEQDSLLADEDAIPKEHQSISLQSLHQNGVPSAVSGNDVAKVEIIDLMESDDEVSDDEDSVPDEPVFVAEVANQMPTAGSGAGTDGGSRTSTTLVSENGVRTIELLPDGKTLRFTKDQSDPFELTVGEKHRLKHSTVEVHETGRLLYTFLDGKAKLAKVPLGASRKKFWCERCGAPGRGGFGSCGQKEHSLSDD